ncbi:hypothetical protein [Mesorhizobium sp. CN2-181]|uniref:hypothetical protein n=1 Tax=Mesorhizobium yinganensis TaxID=3157707 RepID=UPI0032B7FE05
MAAAVVEGQACAICFSGTVVTPGQKLDSADQAVLAVASADGSSFRVVAVVKGDVALDASIAQLDVSLGAAELVMSMDGQTAVQKPSAANVDQPLLLLRSRTSEMWTSLGSIGEQYADWLRQLAATKHGSGDQPVRLWPSKVMAWSPLTDTEWQERLALVWPYADDGQTLAAEIAYRELLRAPYKAMRTLKPRIEVEVLRSWIADPNLSPRRSVYTLLLGVAGDQDDATDLEKRIDQALLVRDATNLSAMLAADLELRGPSRLDWLHTTFFVDRQRTLPEIDAALLALSVHGEADAAIPREEVVEAYRAFINERRPMAGFVATELANWEAWEATRDYVDIIRSKDVKDPAGQFAILSYLKSSPLTAAEAALPAAQ